jgi:hypothetical protein
MKKMIPRVILSRYTLLVISVLLILLFFYVFCEARKLHSVIRSEKLLANAIYRLELEYKYHKELHNTVSNSSASWENYFSTYFTNGTIAFCGHLMNNDDIVIFYCHAHVKKDVPIYIFASRSQNKYTIITTCSINDYSCTMYLKSENSQNLYFSTKPIIIPDNSLEYILLCLQSKNMNWRVFASLDDNMQIKFSNVRHDRLLYLFDFL